MKKIYLACPYTNPDPAIRQMRFDFANRAAGRLMQQGNVVFSPISMSHPIALVYELPTDWNFWENQDKSFLDWADEMRILCLKGWDESKGIRAEIEYFSRSGKLITYIPWRP